MLQLELQHSAILSHTERLPHVLSQGETTSDSTTALQGQAHIQRALNMPGISGTAQQELAQEARSALERTQTCGGSAIETLLHEQVSLCILGLARCRARAVADPYALLCPVWASK